MKEKIIKKENTVIYSQQVSPHPLPPIIHRKANANTLSHSGLPTV